MKYPAWRSDILRATFRSKLSCANCRDHLRIRAIRTQMHSGDWMDWSRAQRRCTAQGHFIDFLSSRSLYNCDPIQVVQIVRCFNWILRRHSVCGILREQCTHTHAHESATEFADFVFASVWPSRWTVGRAFTHRTHFNKLLQWFSNRTPNNK